MLKIKATYLRLIIDVNHSPSKTVALLLYSQLLGSLCFGLNRFAFRIITPLGYDPTRSGG
jgi:hypothetical protein